MDATQGPGVTIVKDEKGQYLVYVAMDGIGYASAVQDVGPRFQQLIANGGPVTIFVDHGLSRFIFAPAHMSAILARGVANEHLYDMPGVPQPPQPQAPLPQEQQQQQQHPNPFNPISEDPTANVAPAFNAPLKQEVPPIVAVEKRIKRPRNSWIIYRSEKSKELHQSRSNMSAGAISTEVARMWAAESAGVRGYYQSLANAEAQEHREKYPDWRYTPAKPKGP